MRNQEQLWQWREQIARRLRPQRKHSGLRYRLYRIFIERRPWYDWGHPVMALIGRDKSGNWAPPRPPDLWYVEDGYHTRWGRRRQRYRVAHSYDDYLTALDGKPDNGWKSIRVEDDGHTLNMGYYSGGFYGLSRSEIPILLRFLLRWTASEWLGVRRWLYFRALHAAVYQRKPFTCQATPPKGSGGYDHWYCQLPRRHTEPHRYMNYTWSNTSGKAVDYSPIGTA